MKNKEIMIDIKLLSMIYHNFVSFVEATIIFVALKGWITSFDSEMNVFIWLLIGFSIILFFIFPLILDIRHNFMIVNNSCQEGVE